MLFLVLKNCVPQRLSTIYMYHVNLYDPRKIYIIWGRWSQLVLNPSQQINKTSTNFFFLITFTGFAFKETRFLKWWKSYFEFFDNYEKQTELWIHNDTFDTIVTRNANKLQWYHLVRNWKYADGDYDFRQCQWLIHLLKLIESEYLYKILPCTDFAV